MSDTDLAMKQLSPLRNSTENSLAPDLAREQLAHFGIDAESEYGQALLETTTRLYQAQGGMQQLWDVTQSSLKSLNQADKTNYFNAKKFLAFQIAKLLDNLQNPFRAVYQQMNLGTGSQLAKGSYPLFDNVPALFSATPVIAKTATYVYACTEWVDDAFHGKEPTHQIYSRLLNPTSIALANAVVDLEAGPYTQEYLAWNFNSGMAAIDAVLSNLLRHGDVLLVARNIYGGVYQLLVDYFAQKGRLDIQLEWFDGYTVEEFSDFLEDVQSRHSERLKEAKLHIYIESPCNPHGFVLDVANICKRAHRDNLDVVLDSTLATPFLNKPLQRADREERPDFVVHSYTKDMAGGGSTTAGGVIGRMERMFVPKGDFMNGCRWQDSMFWDVYYIKGAFLDADKSAEVLAGLKTLEPRLMQKCINTKVLAQFLASNALINVNCNALDGHANAPLLAEQHYLGLPTPLFTFDFEQADIPEARFKAFFDGLEPIFSHQVSIGQNNTLVLCPALTSHSELSPEARLSSGIMATTIRISVGTEDVRELIAHIYMMAKIHIDPECPGFSDRFDLEFVDALLEQVTCEVHTKHLAAGASLKYRVAEL